MEIGGLAVNLKEVTKMAGKFIQIAVAPANDLYALDEEGNVWHFHRQRNKWVLWISDRA